MTRNSQLRRCPGVLVGIVVDEDGRTHTVRPHLIDRGSGDAPMVIWADTVDESTHWCRLAQSDSTMARVQSAYLAKLHSLPGEPVDVRTVMPQDGLACPMLRARRVADEIEITLVVNRRQRSSSRGAAIASHDRWLRRHWGEMTGRRQPLGTTTLVDSLTAVQDGRRFSPREILRRAGGECFAALPAAIGYPLAEAMLDGSGEAALLREAASACGLPHGSCGVQADIAAVFLNPVTRVELPRGGVILLHTGRTDLPQIPLTIERGLARYVRSTQ